MYCHRETAFLSASYVGLPFPSHMEPLSPLQHATAFPLLPPKKRPPATQPGPAEHPPLLVSLLSQLNTGLDMQPYPFTLISSPVKGW